MKQQEDTSKGILYYDDINCRIPIYHKTGFKTIYYLGTSYDLKLKNGKTKWVSKSIPFADFKMAYRRMCAGHESFSDISSVVYDGTKSVTRDMLMYSEDAFGYNSKEYVND